LGQEPQIKRDPFAQLAVDPKFRLIMKHAKFGLSTTSAGIIAVAALCLLHQYFAGDLAPYTWEILISVPVTLLCTGVCSTFYELYIRTTFNASMQAVNMAWDTGVTVLPTHQHAPDRRATLMRSHKRVRIMTTTFSRYFLATSDLVEEKAMHGVAFRFIIYDPESEAIAEKAREEKRDVETFRDEVRSTCARYLGPWVLKYGDRVQVRFCDFNTPYGITVIDEARIVLSLNIYGLARDKNETPCLTIENRYDPHSVFQLYEQSFEAIWKTLEGREIPKSVRRHFERHDTGRVKTAQAASD
jgi:hypothetical protein